MVDKEKINRCRVAVTSMSHNLTGYMIGFEKATDLLFENADEHCLDAIIYPLLNCCQHYIELGLKYCVYKCAFYAVLFHDKEYDVIYPNHHNTVALCAEYERRALLLESTFPGIHGEMQQIIPVVEYFSSLTNNSFASRYHHDKNGKEYDIPSHLRIQDLFSKYEIVKLYFSGAMGYFDEADDYASIIIEESR